MGSTHTERTHPAPFGGKPTDFGNTARVCVGDGGAAPMGGTQPAHSPQAAAHDPSRLPPPGNSPPGTHLGRAGRVKRGRSRRFVLEEKGGRGRLTSRWHRSPRSPGTGSTHPLPRWNAIFPHTTARLSLFLFSLFIKKIYINLCLKLLPIYYYHYFFNTPKRRNTTNFAVYPDTRCKAFEFISSPGLSR